MSEPDTKKLDSCRHCLIGTVVLETTHVLARAEERIMASPYDLSRRDQHKSDASKFPHVITSEKICYCDNCGTLFHAPTYLKNLEQKKAPQ